EYCVSVFIVFFFFFFQAEDGIRDFHVTGVQTCALPIWRDDVAEVDTPPVRFDVLGEHDRIAVADASERPAPRSALHSRSRTRARSEERRVGKGWRCRWSRCH